MSTPIRLVVSDVDGTMVTTAKELLPSTIAAAHRLRDAGIKLALVSSRPPRGMMFIQEQLGLTGPLGGFNGATILAADGSVIEERAVPDGIITVDGEYYYAENPPGTGVRSLEGATRGTPAEEKAKDAVKNELF